MEVWPHHNDPDNRNWAEDNACMRTPPSCGVRARGERLTLHDPEGDGFLLKMLLPPFPLVIV